MKTDDLVTGFGVLNAVLNLILAAVCVIKGENADIHIIKMVLWMIFVEVRTLR